MAQALFFLEANGSDVQPALAPDAAQRRFGGAGEPRSVSPGTHPEIPPSLAYFGQARWPC